jgi:sugar lactone lactonase YvrE
MEIKTFCNNHNILGEGPLWDHRTQTLYWVDIDDYTIHSIDANQQHKRWKLNDKPTSLVLSQNGSLAATLTKNFVLLAPSTQTVTNIAHVIDNPNTMFNDGKCDRQGRYWAGGKYLDVNNLQPECALFRLANQTVKAMDHGFMIGNGLGWSPDNKKMYFSDSPKRVIYQYEFDAQSGNIRNRQTFANIAENKGVPDGLCVDSEGYIWSAHWDGWCVTRYAPDGSINQVIDMPVQRPTSCCFGGKDMRTLFVTSATYELTEAELKKQPHAGNVFAIKVGVEGVLENEFKLE